MDTDMNTNTLGHRIQTDDVHGITYLISDMTRYPINEEYEIPPKYDIDTIVALPVNENKIFVYWELTQTLLSDKLQDPASSNFTVKIYEINAGQKKDDKEKEIWVTPADGVVGSVYIPCTEAFRPMVAAIGVERDGNFVELLRSNHLNVPSFKVLGLKEEFWSKGVLITEEEKVADAPIKEIAPELEQTTDIFEKEMGIVGQLLEIRFKDTESIEVILALIEKLKHLSGDDKTMLDLIKRFFETRVEDIRLLSLFLEFIKFLGQKDKGKESGSGSVREYFEKLKDAAGMPGSSEMSSSERS
ncbi:MAG: DUF4912 domain-containing protein [Nitrospirae bacterium]|uniref:DUF4912 domain-containing protein n=1 Tax=Candidatus Magnetobacterium casense TaxID=1455061 RepID=UPI0005913F16|nr:DUF4912 domain-containing protein [Candidatus Magnetobacterium casensis]MBF0337309.1 DUF4912 domain-containing protein [Nitrospirota bacterium]